MILTQITYELGTLSNWFSALGTIITAIIALYLGSRKTKPKAKVWSKFGYILENRNTEPEYLIVNIVNIGKMPFQLEECSIQMKFKHRLIFKNHDQMVDKFLEPGKAYSHMLNYSQIEEGFLERNNIRFWKNISLLRESCER